MKPTLFGNKHTTNEKITQRMDDCNFSRLNKSNILQRMDDGHSSFSKNRSLQRTDGFNYGGKKNILPLKDRMPQTTLLKI